MTHDEAWDAGLDAYRAYRRAQLGKRFRHDLTLMDDKTVRHLEGVVSEVPYRGATRVTLAYTGLGTPGDDANWDNDRRHYPWVEAPAGG